CAPQILDGSRTLSTLVDKRSNLWEIRQVVRCVVGHEYVFSLARHTLRSVHALAGDDANSTAGSYQCTHGCAKYLPATPPGHSQQLRGDPVLESPMRFLTRFLDSASLRALASQLGLRNSGHRCWGQ